jgi:hypothetical protein
VRRPGSWRTEGRSSTGRRLGGLPPRAGLARGAVGGPPTDVAAEVGRLAAQERQGELDRQAAKTIQHLLTGDRADGAGPPRRFGARTWSIPATAYWLSGPYNHHGHTYSCEQAGKFCISTLTRSSTPKPPASLQARRQGAPASGPGSNHGLGGPPCMPRSGGA